jgi:hypothetical protein
MRRSLSLLPRRRRRLGRAADNAVARAMPLAPCRTFTHSSCFVCPILGSPGGLLLRSSFKEGNGWLA